MIPPVSHNHSSVSQSTTTETPKPYKASDVATAEELDAFLKLLPTDRTMVEIVGLKVEFDDLHSQLIRYKEGLHSDDNREKLDRGEFPLWQASIHLFLEMYNARSSSPDAQAERARRGSAPN